MYYVHSIHDLYVGDLNYVTSVNWQTLRSYTIQYKQTSKCSKSAEKTLEQDSEYALSPETDRRIYQG